MPPKKKCLHKARKAELVFLERPREGPVQCCETPQPSAENPRRVPTKPIDQNTSAAWVCPQFETTTSVVLKTCQKRRGPHRRQNRDANHSFLHSRGACRRAIACKFPPLTFENPEGHAAHPLESPNRLKDTIQRSRSPLKKRTAAEANIQVNSLENCKETHLLSAPQSVEPEIFTPPDVETPQTPFVRKWGCSSTLLQTKGDAWHPGKEFVFDIDPCGREESAAVLVTDTPEHEYGVKVTWRRRPQLMKHLQQLGKLGAADVLVKADPELSRKRTHV